MGPLPAAAGCDCHVCRPEASYDAGDRRAIDGVLAHGWQVMLVSDEVACSCPDHDEHDHDHAGDEDRGDQGPAFAYTLGLGHRAGHPELVMSGLPPSLMHRALNSVAERVMAGRRLRPGDLLEDVLGGVPVAVERLTGDAAAERATWSGWFHRRRPEAFALVWPTTDGVFAWQPGAPAVLDEVQPPSWREPIKHGGGAASDPPWVLPVPADRMAFSCTHVVDGRDAVLWVARQSDPARGEDWTLHCGAPHHPTEEARLVHLAHLVRSAPSVRELADLPADHQAWRPDVDSAWQVEPMR
jgi:hypothetical protein